MKAFRILLRSIRDSLKSVFRNFSLSIASILCTTITLVLVAIAIVVTVNVNHVTKDLEEELTIVVYAKEETTDEELNIAKKDVEEFLNEFLNRISPEAKITVEIKDKCLYISIHGENIGNLIGYRGETLYSIENILKAIANKKSENRVVVRLDIEDYKQKRVETLEEVAKKKASIVERTGKMITLEPMKAYERKIIHSVLQDNPNVETRSIGQEPKRRIVITKK